MRNTLLLGLAVCASFLAAPVPAARAEASQATIMQAPDALRRDLQTAKARVYPALVNISVIFRYFEDGREQRSSAGGSGVIVSKDGYVITNYHVAGNTTHIVCTLTTGESIEADDVVDDPLSDVSVLKLRMSTRTSHTPLAYATLGDSDKMQVGDFVLAMGNPLMLSSSMTLGIVSNTKRVFTDFSGTQMEDMQLDDGQRTGVFTRWIQHDALILPGNSGGPLVNLHGEVVGINELGSDGAGFAIPSNIVRDIYSQVRHTGHVVRGTLGFTVLPVQKIDRSSGALVAGVTPGSPADHAGLLPGDIVLSIDGAPTNVTFFEEVPVLYQHIAQMPIGSHAAIRLLRHGKPMLLHAVVAVLQPFQGDEAEFRTAGVTVRNITADAALANHLPDTHGVIVTGVRAGYPFESAEPGIESGDVIRAVSGRQVVDIGSLRKALATTHGSSYTVSLLRGDENVISVVKADDDDADQDGGDLPQAWIGVKTQVMLPEIASALGVPDQTGFRVTEVYPWTQASKAGLRTGDIIESLNGDQLTASSPQDADDFVHEVQNLNVGDNAALTVLRDGKPLNLTVRLEPGPMAASDAKSAKQSEFDFGVREIMLTDRVQNHWSENQSGLLVTDVTSGGWAQVAGLHTDDLILTVDDLPVTGIDSFNRVMKSVLKSHPKIVRIFVRRDYSTQFVFIEPDWSKLAASE